MQESSCPIMLLWILSMTGCAKRIAPSGLLWMAFKDYYSGKMFDEMLKELNAKVDIVINITASDNLLVKDFQGEECVNVGKPIT